jgi:phosphoribosylformylglycinamidine synthase
MEERPDALLLKYPGTNCDEETARVLRLVGFEPRVIPITRVTEEDLASARLVVFSGGFSYGDYVMAGRLAQLETVRRLGDALKEFVAAGGYVLGICNGFQILVKLGLLPEGSLIDNTSRRFQCHWVTLEKTGKASPYLTKLPDEFELPIAHAEGRYVASEERIEKYLKRGYVVLRYADDVNGSSAEIAGIQDATRRVLGLMPHPERFVYTEHHYDPDWIRRDDAREWGWGYYMFESIYESVMEGAAVEAS